MFLTIITPRQATVLPIGGQIYVPDRCVCPVVRSTRVLRSSSVAAAVAAGVGTAIVGVAYTGGTISDSWIPALCELARTLASILRRERIKN